MANVLFTVGPKAGIGSGVFRGRSIEAVTLTNGRPGTDDPGNPGLLSE